DHVGLDEGGRAVDGAVHVALGGEVEHRVGAVLGQQARHQGPVADVPVHEDVVGVALQRGQGVEVAGIGQRIEVDDPDTPRHRLEYEIAADETGAAGDEPRGQGRISCPLCRYIAGGKDTVRR